MPADELDQLFSSHIHIVITWEVGHGEVILSNQTGCE